MSTNTQRILSNRIHRLIQMVYDIKTNPCQTLDQLLKKYAISKRQFYKDKHVLSELGFDFAYNRQQKRYNILRDAYIPVENLTISERLLLILSMRHLSATGETVLTIEGLQAAQKLAADLPGTLQEIARVIFDEYILNESFGCKQDVFDKLSQALMDSRRIQIDYVKPDSQTIQQYILEPYFIFFKRRALYVEGISVADNDIRMFRIKRITHVKMTREFFTRSSTYAFTERHKNAFSVFPGIHTQKVVVRFNQNKYQYIQESLWHQSQRITPMPDQSFLFTVHVAEPREVLWWALQWGADAEIIEPEWLRKKARLEIQKMMSIYNQ